MPSQGTTSTCSPKTPDLVLLECGTGMLVGTWSVSTMLRGRHGPPCYFTSRETGLESLGICSWATECGLAPEARAFSPEALPGVRSVRR